MRFHRSEFFTGCFCEFFHPRLSQPSTQCWLNAFTRYWESEYNVTWQGRLSASRATMAPSSSMRLFVVQRYPCENSRSCTPPLLSTKRRMLPYPPGPGLPRDAPSEYKSTCISKPTFRTHEKAGQPRCRSWPA